MSLAAALHDHLKNDAGVSALVSDRIYPRLASSSAALPRITYHMISADHQRHMTAAAGIVQRRVQIDCWATTHLGAFDLAEAVREALDHLHHMTIGSGNNTQYVHGAFLDNEFDVLEPPAHGDQVGVHSVKQDWMIWHTETVPTHS